MQDTATTPSNQAAMQPKVQTANAAPGWHIVCRLVGDVVKSERVVPNKRVYEKTASTKPTWPASVKCKTEAELNASDALIEIFAEGEPLLAQDVFEWLDSLFLCNRTTFCPIALKFGITKVKRKSGWWWVPPGIKEPTLAATREDPWAEEPK